MEQTSELKTLWADSFDGWVGVPEADCEVMYMRPGGCKEPSNAAGNSSFSFPPIVYTCRIFAITAWNPMGKDHQLSFNTSANSALEADLTSLPNPVPRALWRGFGFSSDWREDGFVIAFEEEDADAGRDAMKQLATKYRQGAIYEYSPGEDPAVLLRKTVGVLMQDVEADVWITRCTKPPIENADLPPETMAAPQPSAGRGEKCSSGDVSDVSSSPVAGFVPCQSGFEGAREGYYFGTGAAGVGYYPDHSRPKTTAVDRGADSPASTAAARSGGNDPTAEEAGDDEAHKQHKERIAKLEKAVAKLDKQIKGYTTELSQLDASLSGEDPERRMAAEGLAEQLRAALRALQLKHKKKAEQLFL
eukprot:CAMPEP_0118938888 /NCGR_PEP_ID=MMETSP1169-20130426/27339_1 /TAXON_ID=36882 /ORGANISM="Pyramimonas obovata, Strain CCMP722" /LENGTH=360 /DNA_ID=CAMNT_0006882989 /DNA_START=589 /DNA_END=1667 /DNA_ORIENTATION=-